MLKLLKEYSRSTKIGKAVTDAIVDGIAHFNDTIDHLHRVCPELFVYSPDENTA